ncbi:MAG: Lrp/AsnC family transcriptional regulator [Halobacteriota archaeon]|uniref:Lrp/AsnC family transcriptional regulator n=1 Tax=Natronomonas sp. TaxID=2184060 RepID=UPI0039769AEF
MEPDAESLALDRHVVAALCRGCRADIRDLAAAVDAVPTTVQKRVRTLEENGTIDGYAAQLDYGELGYETVVFRLRVDLDAVDRVTDRLRSRSAFTTVYHTSGPESVFAIGLFENAAAIGACLRELHDDPDVCGIDTDTVVSTRRENDCPIPD